MNAMQWIEYLQKHKSKSLAALVLIAGLGFFLLKNNREDSYCKNLTEIAPYHEKFLNLSRLDKTKESLTQALSLKEEISQSPEGKEVLYGYTLWHIAICQKKLGELEEKKQSLNELSQWMDSHPFVAKQLQSLTENKLSLLDYLKD